MERSIIRKRALTGGNDSDAKRRKLDSDGSYSTPGKKHGQFLVNAMTENARIDRQTQVELGMLSMNQNRSLSPMEGVELTENVEENAFSKKTEHSLGLEHKDWVSLGNEARKLHVELKILHSSLDVQFEKLYALHCSQENAMDSQDAKKAIDSIGGKLDKYQELLSEHTQKIGNYLYHQSDANLDQLFSVKYTDSHSGIESFLSNITELFEKVKEDKNIYLFQEITFRYLSEMDKTFKEIHDEFGNQRNASGVLEQ